MQWVVALYLLIAAFAHAALAAASPQWAYAAAAGDVLMLFAIWPPSRKLLSFRMPKVTVRWYAAVALAGGILLVMTASSELESQARGAGFSSATAWAAAEELGLDAAAYEIHQREQRRAERAERADAASPLRQAANDLATLDQQTLDLSEAVIAEYEGWLRQMSAKCNLEPRELGDMAVLAYDMLHERGQTCCGEFPFDVRINALKWLDAAVPEGVAMDCVDVLGTLVAF